MSAGSGIPRLSSPQLIGRDDQLRSLAAAATRPPSLVLLAGEAGVGKTRLVRELLAELPPAGPRVLVGHCHDLREPFPLGPLIEALRAVAGTLPEASRLSPVAATLRPLLPELADELPPPLEPLDDPPADRHRLFRGIRELLRALGPTVLVLEDLHWVDRLSYELLGFLVSELPSELSVVLTYRPEDVSASPPIGALAGRLPAESFSTAISLAPLDGRGVQRLVAAILDRDDISEELAAHLHARTLGLPFAVEEVVRLLIDRRGLDRRTGHWTAVELEALEVPAVLRDSILGRFGLIAPDARRVAEAAAVLAIPASEELIAEVSELTPDRSRRALAEALSAALVHEVEDRAYGFRHTLARQAVYEAIPAPVRRELHRRAAHALAAGGDPLPLAQLARHFREGDRRREWVFYAEAAADRALELGDDAAAFELLRDVVLAPDLPPAQLAPLAVKLGRAAYTGLTRSETIPVLRRALDNPALPAVVRGELRLNLGLLLVNHDGRVSQGREELARAAATLERRRPALAARAMSALAGPMSNEETLDGHLTWMDRAVAVASRTGDRRLQLTLAGHRAAVLMFVGDPRARDALREVPEMAASFQERRDLAQTWGNFAYGLVWVGHCGESETYLRKALDLVAHSGDEHMRRALEATRLVARWMIGHWDGLEEQAARVAESAPDVQPTIVETRLIRGLLRLAGGDMRTARSELSAVAEHTGTTGFMTLVPASSAGLARLLLAQGEAEQARWLVMDALAWVRAKGIWALAADLAPTAVDVLLAGGRDDEAARMVREFAAGVRGRDTPAADAALAHCRGKLAAARGRTDKAARLFAAAERDWFSLPRPYDAAQALEAHGCCLVETGNVDGGPVMLEALDRYEALGARWDAARVRKTMRRHAIVLRRRPGRRGYGGRLSPREAEVARLAGTGQTNREIARALFLSPRTVEEHVANAMRKLGAASRDALADAGTGKDP